MKTFFRVFFLVSLVSIRVWSDDLPTMAVLDLNVKSGSSIDEARAVSRQLREAIAARKTYRVLVREEMTAVLNEQNVDTGGCSDNECALKIGKLLVARYICAGTIMRVMDQVYISATVISVSEGSVVSSANESIAGEDAVAASIDSLANRLCGGVRIIRRPAQRNHALDPVLFSACEHCDLSSIVRCLEQGADPDFQKGPHHTYHRPVEIAACNDCLDAVKLLLENGAQPGRVYAAAAEQNRVRILEYLLERKVPPVVEHSGVPAVVVAARFVHEEPVVMLIAHGADINARLSSSGWTPLMMAACYGHLNIVKLLISKGADPDLENNAGRTALQVAKKNDHKEIVRYLKSIQ